MSSDEQAGRQDRPVEAIVGPQWQVCATHGPANPNVWGCKACETCGPNVARWEDGEKRG